MAGNDPGWASLDQSDGAYEDLQPITDDDDKITHGDLMVEMEDDSASIRSHASDQQERGSNSEGDTEPYHITFEELFPLEEGKYYGETTHSFAGALWRMLVLVQEGHVGVFTVVANMQELPQTWQANVGFSFQLVDPTDEEKSITSNSDKFRFEWVRDLNPDRGYMNCFLRSTAEKKQHEPGKMLLRCTLKDANWVAPPYNSKRATGMVGIQNLGATCYLNSLLQMLHHLNSFRKAVYDIPVNDEDAVDSSMTLALQGVFHNLQTGDVEVGTHDLTKAFGWDSLEAFQQQDVQEMMRILLDRLEEKMKKTPVDGMVQKLFEGQVQSYIRCVDVDFSSKREEAFYDIQLDVKGCRNLYESFQRYVAKEMLTGENQYEAEGHGKQDAEKGVIFQKFPPVLTIHLKRFEFDLARFGFSKIHDRFEFPTRICLDDFVDEDAPAEHKEGNTYLLHSVLVHSGDVMGGHYTAFIRPSPPNDYSKWVAPSDADDLDVGSQWFKFDDEMVKKSSEKEAVVSNFGDGMVPGVSPLTIPRRHVSLSSAYMLVYIRESSVMEVMNPIPVEEIPSRLRERLHDEEKRKRRAELVRLEEKRYSSVPYATEQHVAEFKDYSHRADFVPATAKLPKLRLLRSANHIGLLRALACELQIPPCRLRLWPIIHRENATTRIDCSRELENFSDLAQKQAYVEVLPEDPRLAQYAEKLDELDAEEAKLLKQLNIRSPPYLWRNGPVDRSLMQYDDIDASEALWFGDGIGMGAHSLANSLFPSKFSALEEQYGELLQDVANLYRRDPDEHLIFLKLFDPASPNNLRYLGSMLFDLDQPPQALYEAALDIAGISGAQADGVCVLEEITPGEVKDILDDSDTTLLGKENTTGDIFIVQLPSRDTEESDEQLGQETQEAFERRLESMFEAKTATQFFEIHAAKRRVTFIPAFKSDEAIFRAAADAYPAVRHGFAAKPEMRWHVEDGEIPELRVQLLTTMTYSDAITAIARRLGVADPLRLQLHPCSESRRARPYHSPAAMLKHGLAIGQLISPSRGSPQVLRIAVTPFPCTVEHDTRSLEVHIVDVRLRMQRRQYLLELQSEHAQNGADSPTTSEDSRTVWQVDEPIGEDIALTDPTLCFPVPADALSEKVMYVLADPSQSLANLASHVRRRCGLSSEIEEELEAQVQHAEGDDLHHGNGHGGVMNGESTAEAKDVDVADSTVRRPARFCHTSTEVQADGGANGVLLFTASTQKIERLFLPTDPINDIGLSWMDSPTVHRPERLNAQLVTATEARFMLRRAPVNSIPVKVLFFTMYGQLVQALLESDMFVTYLREDDTMDSLLLRLGRITGDPQRVVEKYRLAVIHNFSPFFIHRDTDDAASTRKRTRDSPIQEGDGQPQQQKKTRVVEVEGEAETKGENSLADIGDENGDADAEAHGETPMQMSQHMNGSTAHNGTGHEESAANVEAPTSIWSQFARRYPLHMTTGNRGVIFNTDDYPVLGVQRPSGGEWGTRRPSQRFATGIKIR